MSDHRLDALLAYVTAERRVCPMPGAWDKLWRLLGGESLPPLILAAWDTPWLFKQARLQAQIRYAAEHGMLGRVDRFMRSLPPEGTHPSYSGSGRLFVDFFSTNRTPGSIASSISVRVTMLRVVQSVRTMAPAAWPPVARASAWAASARRWLEATGISSRPSSRSFASLRSWSPSERT